MLARPLAWLAVRHGKLPRLWRGLARPSDPEWTEYLRRWGGFRHIGAETTIPPSAAIGDPELTWIGDNVLLSTCALVGHDASGPVLSRAYDETLAGVFGPTIIRDNVFIGFNAVILPGITVGSNVVIGAGCVVTKDVPPDSVVVGAPGRVVGTVSDLVKSRREKTRDLPWFDLIERQRLRLTGKDLSLQIRSMRADHFFDSSD